MKIYTRTLFVFLCLTLLCALPLRAKEGIDLRFKSGTFRILQLTDTHWAEGKETCAKTEQLIRWLVQNEKPDLAILTGDIITAHPAEAGWRSLIRIFEDLKLPFAVTMGNHDAEYWTREAIYALLETSPYFVGSYGDKDLTGGGNFTLPIYTEQGDKVSWLLYAIDSNDYLPADSYSHYAWIANDQIQWYRRQSLLYKETNGGKPLPSLAFFHIPLMEYRQVLEAKTYLGLAEDSGIASPEVNSGLFASFLDMQDVRGVFVGHDHNNDFIGLHKGIALAYGRGSGFEAYGHLERGGRMIVLREGTKHFETWISTPQGKEPVFYYPSGINSKQESTMTYLPAQAFTPGEKGLSYRYYEYEGKCRSVSEIAKMPLKRSGQMKSLSISSAEKEDYFAYQFRSYIHIPKRGVYRFFTFSDDGSKLWVDAREVVDNDGGHKARRRSGEVALEPGWHELRLDYYESYLGQELKLGIESKDLSPHYIPDEWYHLPKDK